MNKVPILLTAGLLALAGCGDDDSENDRASAPEEAAMEKKDESAPKKEKPADERTGTTITSTDSEFGEMLFSSDKQAIYIFENDRPDESVCYDDCAEAWPPVFTEGGPKAAKGVDQSLLGTIERRDGRRQVTYAGKPLYYYAHEGPGEVRCHNVFLNGGYWWVIGPDGERRP